MKSFNLKNSRKILVLLTGALLLRLILSFFGTLALDQGTFIAWGNSLFANGFKTFYNSWSDYLPGYPYILWLLGSINSYGLIPDTVLFKIPAILADIATGLIIYKILLKSKGERWALAGAAIYVFNPAIIANSSLWGQVDSLTALTSMFSVFILPANLILSSISLAVGTLIKPQVAFIFPIVMFLMLKNKKKFWKFLLYIGVGLSVFAAAFIPYWNHSSLISFIYERLGISLNQYPYTSVNAFNFWGLLGTWKPDNLYLQLGGYIFVMLLTLLLSFKLWKNKNSQYVLMSFVFAATFMFFTRMHERHLLPVFAPLAVAAIENPLLLIPFVGFSLTYLGNIYYSYIWITDNFKEVFPDLFIKFIEIINIGFVVSVFYILFANLKVNWKKYTVFRNKFISDLKKPKIKAFVFPKVKLTAKKAKIILGIILVFAFIARVFALNSPPSEYFDEVYHAFTARIILHADPKAWEWWNTPPEGFAYEWTHPPLAKLGMVLGMLIFGENSFGWRIPGALLGVGSVYIIYLIAKRIFDDEVVGLLSAAVLSLDGLMLVMSRIGMNDSYILFFVLLSIYLYLKDRNFLSALAFGFALASKWSSIWSVPIFGIIFLTQKKKLNLSYAWFFTLPLIVYLGTYLDLFLTGHDLGTWWGMQQQMWWYHTGLRATHPYGSAWWTWPFLIRPIYLYTSDEIGGMVSRIYAFGNPLVFWFGLASVVSCAVLSYLEKNKKLALIVFSYLIFFVPWALSPRIMFIYHYLPSIPFLAIGTGYILRRYPKIIPYFFIASLMLFVYFYPHWAGLKIPLWLDQSYYWVRSWR